MPNELVLPVHYHRDMPDHTRCPLGHAYVDVVGKLYIKGGTKDSPTWALLGKAEDFLGPSPDEKRYLRRSLGIQKGVRLQ